MTAFDTWLFLALNATAQTPGWALAVGRWMSTDLPVLAIVGLAPLALSGARSRRQLLGVCLAMVLAWLTVRGIREAVHVARPFELGLGQQWLTHSASASFPSFHAAVAAAWATGLALFAPSHPRVWLVVAGGMALAIAWSRVFLGLHFVSDLAAGVTLGIASAVTARQCLAWVGRRRAAPALRPMAGSETR